MPRAVVFALIGAAVGFGVFLIERPGDSGPSPQLKRLIGRADEICTESRVRFNGAASRRVETFEQAARQVEHQHADLGVGAAPASPAQRASGGRRRVVGLPDLREVQISRLEQARKAALGGNNLAYQRAQRKLAEGRRIRFEAARRVGLRQCSRGGVSAGATAPEASGAGG